MLSGIAPLLNQATLEHQVHCVWTLRKLRSVSLGGNEFGIERLASLDTISSRAFDRIDH
jgi:hypothetical protein